MGIYCFISGLPLHKVTEEVWCAFEGFQIPPFLCLEFSCFLHKWENYWIESAWMLHTFWLLALFMHFSFPLAGKQGGDGEQDLKSSWENLKCVNFVRGFNKIWEMHCITLYGMTLSSSCLFSAYVELLEKHSIWCQSI